MSIEILDHPVTVCDNCLQASCWQRIFMCDGNKCAGTVEKPVGYLMSLRLESPDYWFRDPNTGKVDEEKVAETYVFDRLAIEEWNEASEPSDDSRT